MKKILLLATAAMLAGCSAISTAQLYDQSPETRFQNVSDGRVYKIFDNPRTSSLLIGPSSGEAFIMGATVGLTARPEIEFQSAAVAYLSSTNRKCTAISASPFVAGAYEVKYSC